jgi:hypothetical protein
MLPATALLYVAAALPSTGNSKVENDAAKAVQSIDDQVRLLEGVTGAKFERKLSKLPLSYTKGGLLQRYGFVEYELASYRDGINSVDRTPFGVYSVSEKYANAFGLNSREFQDKVSKKSGVDANSNGKVCTSDSQCDKENYVFCGIRAGQKTGYCISARVGLQTRAPVTFLEAAPRCPVTMNNVTFSPADIAALLLQFYDGFELNPAIVGTNYNGPAIPEYDEYGRPTDPAHRDVNPGMFVLALTNLIGIQNRPFVEDYAIGYTVDPDIETWALGKYNLTSIERLTLEDGAQKFWNVTKYPFNSNAASLVYMEEGSWGYRFVLELNSNDEIIGGEWLPRHAVEEQYKFYHPDFLWLPTSKPTMDSVSDIGIAYSRIAELLRKSRGRNCAEYCQKAKQFYIDDVYANPEYWCGRYVLPNTYPLEKCLKDKTSYAQDAFEICIQPEA